MKRVAVRLVGGLGNQLHCYAFGRAIAKQNRVTLVADCESGYWSDPYNRQYLLDEFPNLRANKKTMPNSRMGRLAYKLVLRLVTELSRLFPLTLRSVVIEPRPLRYHEDIHRANYRVNPCFIGYWASYLYYQDVADQLRKDLEPPRPHHPAVLRVLEGIESVESCAIHWRSYVEEKGGFHPSLADYYREAVWIMLRKHPSARFFVFSDNHEAARSELASLGNNVVFVDLPESRGDKQSLNDFYLMYSCNHAIIGDSTFSWWAAWLSDRKEKTIVSPRGLSPWGSDWSPPHWISIPINI